MAGSEKPFMVTNKNWDKYKKYFPQQTLRGQYLVKACKFKLLRRPYEGVPPIFHPMPVHNNHYLICDKLAAHGQDVECQCGKMYHQYLVNLDAVHNIGFEIANGPFVGPIKGVKMSDTAGLRTVDKYNKHERVRKELNNQTSSKKIIIMELKLLVMVLLSSDFLASNISPICRSSTLW